MESRQRDINSQLLELLGAFTVSLVGERFPLWLDGNVTRANQQRQRRSLAAVDIPTIL